MKMYVGTQIAWWKNIPFSILKIKIC